MVVTHDTKRNNVTTAREVCQKKCNITFYWSDRESEQRRKRVNLIAVFAFCGDGKTKHGDVSFPCGNSTRGFLDFVCQAAKSR